MAKKKGRQKSGDPRKQTGSKTREEIRLDFQRTMLTAENRESMANETFRMIDAFDESEPLAHMFSDEELMIVFGAMWMCKKGAEYAGKPIGDGLIHQLKILDIGTEREKLISTFLQRYEEIDA